MSLAVPLMAVFGIETRIVPGCAPVSMSATHDEMGERTCEQQQIRQEAKNMVTAARQQHERSDRADRDARSRGRA
ncbi:hypothetical protein WS70_15930 [Burkholderia mayonis]|uniref:Uncharacterized protein n=1 Tax=Burkholderia mayonis TaxID=1385591 RepID=A0A1B4FHG1_9BURK|nr:hypothetical protein WS70_15930 [Burkholderia mayonis]KVE39053.1 hypothetical protein WS69_01535 [Burkholderia sp. BDU5]KVE48263.1 hypothetical protein WS70_24305 [Burkholderia mayonis]